MRMLADSGAPRAYEALVDIAGKSRGQTRVSALELLARSRPGDAGITQLLTDSLRSGRRDESNYAASVLGRLGTEPARQALVAMLSSKDKDLANMAAASLGELGMTDSTKSALVAAARTSPEIKQQVMGQLLQAGDPDGMRFAEELLRDGESAASTAVYALINVGTPEARRLLDGALTAQDPSVRIAAISSLMQSSDDRATEALMRMTRDPDAQVRATALSTLGQFGSERAQQAVLEAARSARPEDRVAAINGLTSLDDPRASAQLVQMMRDPDPSVAQTAIGSSYNGGPEVDHALVAIVNDPSSNGDIRQFAARALRNRGTEVDPATDRVLTELSGPATGGAGYGQPLVKEVE
jgi:HEAT repeat protein